MPAGFVPQAKRGIVNKMSDFIVNIIHRPEMVPEYAEKVRG